MDTIKKLSDYGILINSDIKFMGVPKTIDNDLAVTDHTPGFGSAAKFIAATMKEIIRDGLVYDYPTITIVEIMGRNAGWLTAAAALAKGEDCEGVDLIYLPERYLILTISWNVLNLSLQKVVLWLLPYPKVSVLWMADTYLNFQTT